MISSNTAGPREAIPCTPHCGGVLLGLWLAPQKHPDDSADFRGVLGKCTRCFAKRVPKSWFVSRHGTVEGKDIPDLEVDTESSATSGSETDDSVDTQSEADAVPLPKPDPRPGAPWPWNGVREGAGTQATHLGLPASYGNGGCARQTSGLGESYCLTHPRPPSQS